MMSLNGNQWVLYHVAFYVIVQRKSFQYAFLESLVSRLLWKEVVDWFDVVWVDCDGLDNLLLWWRRKSRVLPLKHSWKGLVFIVLQVQGIWRATNKRCYENLFVDPYRIVAWIVIKCKDLSVLSPCVVRTARDLRIASNMKLVTGKGRPGVIEELF
ncbi:hypothetical protein NE237_015550 [Protea cynaroides]|uniref:Uncharacterized protein n=1 Tax=Protea cynaroides TaxID=273540 RepID=A0A9Q0QRB7_9MAGN|nr:hypothetical protein NE237_015550 [Protea cynaroides]